MSLKKRPALPIPRIDEVSVARARLLFAAEELASSGQRIRLYEDKRKDKLCLVVEYLYTEDDFSQR